MREIILSYRFEYNLNPIKLKIYADEDLKIVSTNYVRTFRHTKNYEINIKVYLKKHYVIYVIRVYIHGSK